jgi:outer membrane protein assembly factor BamB
MKHNDRRIPIGIILLPLISALVGVLLFSFLVARAAPPRIPHLDLPWSSNVLVSDNRISGASLEYPALAVSPVLSNTYAAWVDNRNGRNELYFARSANGGLTWGSNVRITSPNAVAGLPPALAADSSLNVHLVWQAVNSFYTYVYYRRSADGGGTWSAAQRLDGSAMLASATSPDVVFSQPNTVFVVWADNTSLYLIRSTDGGLTWPVSPAQILTSTTSMQNPAITVDISNTLHLAWEETASASPNPPLICYARSTDAGLNWTARQCIGQPLAGTTRQTLPDIAADPLSGQVQVVWEDDRTGAKQIFFVASADHGLSWSTPILISGSGHPASAPSLTVDRHGILAVAWQDGRNVSRPYPDNDDIYTTRSIDGGLSWAPPERVNDDSSYLAQRHPAIVASKTGLVIAWDDNRSGNLAIYAASLAANLFNGHVWYTPGTSQPETTASLPGLPGQLVVQTKKPVAGAFVSLLGYASANSASQVLGSAHSLPDGSFELATYNAGFHHYEVFQGDNRGLLSDQASASSGGLVLNPRTVRWPGSSSAYKHIDFDDVDPYVFYPWMTTRYLIVTTQAVVDAHALDDFIAYKRFLGFNMLVKTVEQLGATGSDQNAVRLKIRDYEKQLFDESASLKYVLLIGTDSTIPYFKSNPFERDVSHNPTQDWINVCGFTPTLPNTCGWPSDWYYVDLTSEWDSNHDGVLGENIFPDLSVGPPQHLDDPPAFATDVYLGRLQMDDPATIKSVLQTIMDFEQDGGTWKKNALLAGAVLSLSGKKWDPPDDPAGSYKDLPPTTDTADPLQMEINDFLQPAGFDSIRLFEKESANGIPPNSYPVDAPLSYENIISKWQAHDYGLVKFSGHGGAGGIARVVWDHDYLPDQILEGPTQPLTDSKSLYEAEMLPLADLAEASSIITPHHKAPLLLVQSCSTGDAYDPDNLPNTFLSAGRISGWIGAVQMAVHVYNWKTVADGSGQTLDYYIAREQVTGNQSFGEAFWNAMADFYADGYGFGDLNFIDWDLYGDPSLSYWGNGPDLRAPWPMFHHDLQGSGQTSLSGPALPQVKWAENIAATAASADTPSPVINSQGQVVIGDYAGWVRAFYPTEDLAWSYHAGNGPIANAPAVALDGTVYVKSGDGVLYAINSDGTLKWSDAVGDGNGSPKIGMDGRVYVGGSDNDGPGGSKRYFLAAYHSSGVLVNTRLVDARITTTPSIASDNSVWIGTANGTLYKLSPDLSASQSFAITPGYQIGNGLALANSGNTVLVPSYNNRLVNWDNLTHTISWTKLVSAPVRGAPAIRNNTKVFFGTQDGKIYALNMNDGSQIWEYDTAGPVDSSPALDNTNLYIVASNADSTLLLALRQYDGSLFWEVHIGGTSTGGSSPAIGTGHMLYVASSAGKLLAFGPKKWTLPSAIEYTRPVKIPPLEILVAVLPPPDPEDLVQLERRTPGDDWTVLGTLSAGNLVYEDRDVVAGQTYEYRDMVLASGMAKPLTGPGFSPTQSSEASDYSPIVSAQALPEAPGAPSKPVVQPLSATDLQVSWSLVDTSAVTMTLRRSQFGVVGIQKFVLPGGITTTVDSGLQPSTLYTYTLQAFNTGGSSPLSPPGSGTTNSQTLTPPTQVTVQVIAGKFKVCWHPSAGDLDAVVARRAEGELSPHIVGYVPAGQTCFTDTSALSYAYQYLVKHVQGQNESDWAMSIMMLSPNCPCIASHIYLPLIRH